MSSIVLFHSALGLRPAVLADAERLRDAGHTVLTPDLYGGAVFDDVDEGMAHNAGLGWEELAGHAAAVVGPGQVLAGYSFGAGVAQWLAETRRDAAGVLLLSGGGAPKGVWPAVPAQLHAALDDVWVDDTEVAQLAAAGVEVFRYTGGHLFADPDLADYDAASTARMWERVFPFLEGLR